MDRRFTKRGKPNFPPSLAKRPRLLQANSDAMDHQLAGDRGSSSLSAVMVSGLPLDCTVLELKYRLEMYGSISRIRIDPNCSGYVTFRSNQSAEAAIAASVDPQFGISIRSSKLLVARASDPVAHWRLGVRASSTSKLLRAEKPLSRHGRTKKQIIPGTLVTKKVPQLSYAERKIRAYDDLF
ncbi:hypothetical protein KSP40_PGU018194 [Platanthera guangdongensis]|uniref:RRM domain-containing protein n=1 Tax=Platanthera guangdongensis TaxID=2320717 RepID=A0ABR2MCG0_9ASPA